MRALVREAPLGCLNLGVPRHQAGSRGAQGREVLVEDEAKFIGLPCSPLWQSREEMIHAGTEGHP